MENSQEDNVTEECTVKEGSQEDTLKEYTTDVEKDNSQEITVEECTLEGKETLLEDAMKKCPHMSKQVKEIPVAINQCGLPITNPFDNLKKRNIGDSSVIQELKKRRVNIRAPMGKTKQPIGKGLNGDSIAGPSNAVHESENSDIEEIDESASNRKYTILDEVEGSDIDEDGIASGDESSDEEEVKEDVINVDEDVINDEELEAMLDEGIDFNEVQNTPTPNKHIIEKEVLEKLRVNHFEMLPEGWLESTHISGMPVYLNKNTRVVTMSRPYFLGPGSLRKHKIPTSAIPCFEYRKQLEDLKEKEENQVEISEDKIEEAILTSAKVVTADENIEKNSISADEMKEYCKKLFRFKKIRVRKFQSWVVKRAYVHKQKCKTKKSVERPTLPSGTKLITVPVFDKNLKTMTTREWAMNPNGKSYVCILHEYLQRALKKKPEYEYKELENAKTPYSATIKLNNTVYGTGIASSKKQAKIEAAKATLEILIPEMRNVEPITSAPSTIQDENEKYSIFDSIKITDPRVTEFCAKATEPSPFSMLLTCLERNHGIGPNSKITYNSKPTKHSKILFYMRVKEFKAKALCKNKREGKQKASQQILQLLHPHISHWGSLLRLYGNTSIKRVREKKNQEQEITQLQSKATHNSPNFAILDKLKGELRKIYVDREEMKNKKSFVLPAPSSTSCDSNLNFELPSTSASSHEQPSTSTSGNDREATMEVDTITLDDSNDFDSD